MKTRKAKKNDLDAWVKLRYTLWPESTPDALLAEAKSILTSLNDVCFLLFSPSEDLEGFIESSIYSGTEGPYAHVEGWYVSPKFRGQGLGKKLIEEIEQWCLHRTISILTSDTTANYPLSPDAHASSGFKKVHEFSIFIKELQ